MLMSLASVMAPILPHMAEDVWQTLPFEPEGGHRCANLINFEVLVFARVGGRLFSKSRE